MKQLDLQRAHEWTSQAIASFSRAEPDDGHTATLTLRYSQSRKSLANLATGFELTGGVLLES